MDKIRNSIFWLTGLIGLIAQIFGVYIILFLILSWKIALIISIIITIIESWKSKYYEKKGGKFTFMRHDA